MVPAAQTNRPARPATGGVRTPLAEQQPGNPCYPHGRARGARKRRPGRRRRAEGAVEGRRHRARDEARRKKVPATARCAPGEGAARSLGPSVPPPERRAGAARARFRPALVDFPPPIVPLTGASILPDNSALAEGASPVWSAVGGVEDGRERAAPGFRPEWRPTLN